MHVCNNLIIQIIKSISSAHEEMESICKLPASMASAMESFRSLSCNKHIACSIRKSRRISGKSRGLLMNYEYE